MLRTLPPGYVDQDRGRWRVIAPRLELAEMTALLAAARDGRAPGEAVESGRGGARRIELPGGKVLFLRQYLRGGWMRVLTRDLFLLRPPRPLRELLVTEAARSAGCRVPLVHAVAIEEAGPFYRGWIVTSAIDGARAFIDEFFAAGTARREELLGAAGAAIRDLHRAGVFHPDLNGHNLLIDGDGEIAVIDFDLAFVGDPGDEASRRRGRERFLRSLRKLTARRGARLEEDAPRWLERGYAG